jgi:hypothetical protein
MSIDLCSAYYLLKIEVSMPTLSLPSNIVMTIKSTIGMSQVVKGEL